VCVPDDTPLTASVAVPLAVNAAVPSSLAPSKNRTIPVRRSGAWRGHGYVAVSVTGCPKLDGFDEEFSAVAVEAGTTVSVPATKDSRNSES